MIPTTLLSQLLQSHDCVIVPNIGAFIAHAHTAEISIIDKQICPPHKKISFNSSINQNDGLLAHAVAQKNNCSFEDATLQTQQQCSIWQTKMLLGEIISFENVGKLWMDLEHKIQFKPAHNFLQSHQFYGLEVLNIAPIVREEIKETVIKFHVQNDDKGLHPQGYLNDFISSEKQKSNSKIWLKLSAAAVLVGLIILASWFSIENPSTVNNMASIVSLDSFFKNNQPEKVVVKKNISTKNNSVENVGLQHPYTFYLDNPAEPYYLITDTNLNFVEANNKKLKYWKEGCDARIIQIDSFYQIGLYHFTTADNIQKIKSETDSLLHVDCKLMKLI